jgi:hypothetical protein
MWEGTDIACALVGGAYIENATGALLERTMINDPAANGPNGVLNDPKGILSAAGPRADMCYCLGLIDKTTHNNAKQIASVRNRFAHSHVPIAFNDEEIKSMCEPLVAWLGDSTTGSPRPLDRKTSEKILSDPRRKFVLATCWTLLEIQKATFTDIINNESGDRIVRIREKPTYAGARALLNVEKNKDNKLVFRSHILLDE